ncbi:MAG: carboxylating nicotinate-nucleotide diphosphorylase [SAR324 cluster bacterium]|nr:carboxylating nicotinate-nucleotide diphosphorylase [SAR324 cluster bacterium]
MNWYNIYPIIQMAIEEDLSWGDITSESLIDPNWTIELILYLKQDGVIAGLPVAELVFRELEPELEWTAHQEDGQFLTAGTPLASISGRAQFILKAERVALNFLQRLSGIATLTSRFVTEARKGSSTVRIVDTRKTTPGLRILEKYAVRMGGGHNHRHNLSDGVLIKDNHLAIIAKAGKSVKETLISAKQKIPHVMKMEMEVDSISQIPDALEAGIDVILLDNMNCEEMIQAVKEVQGRALLEASGGVTLKTIENIAATGVDIISVGALTHSAPALDISLDYQ